MGAEVADVEHSNAGASVEMFDCESECKSGCRKYSNVGAGTGTFDCGNGGDRNI